MRAQPGGDCGAVVPLRARELHITARIRLTQNITKIDKYSY